MKALILSFCLLLAIKGYTCSLAFQPFCNTSLNRNTDAIILGKITDTIAHGIKLQVISVLRGTEMRDTVIIWDGTDIDCNGPFPMNAAGMGTIGDTILTVMEVIDTLKELWQVTGDYVRPDNFGYTTELSYKNDTLYGLISGPPSAPAEYQVRKLSYSGWLTLWNSGNTNCSLIAGLDETPNGSFTLYPNPADKQIFVTGVSNKATVTVWHIGGGRVTVPIIDATILNIGNLPPGSYYAEIEDGGKRVVRKFIKTD
jgi:hypothetical protein